MVNCPAELVPWIIGIIHLHFVLFLSSNQNFEVTIQGRSWNNIMHYTINRFDPKIIKSPRYTGGDFMFLNRFVRRRRRRRRRRRPQILVHAITFEQLFGFFSIFSTIVGPDP